MDKKFTEITKSSKNFIYAIHGTDAESGKPAWWIVEVDKVKQPIIKNAQKYKQLKISDYGKILDSGFGDKAPEDILAKFSA